MRYGFDLVGINGTHSVSMSEQKLDSYMSKVVGAIQYVEANTGETPSFLSVSTRVYEALMLNTKQEGAITFPDRFMGMQLVINPYQDADVVPLLRPVDEYKRSW